MRSSILTRDRTSLKFQQIEAESRTGIILFLTAGFPDLEATLKLVPELVQAGADCIELGVPFSDPLADGPTIQASSFHALQNNVTLDNCIQVVRELRGLVPDTPLVLFSYYNPILSYGLEAFGRDAGQAGVDGVIVPDLPPDESGPLRQQCTSQGIHMIPLLAPTSTDARIQRACQSASGFIYCVNLTGVTGARNELPTGAFTLLERVRRYTDLPLAAGFGISRKEHVRSIGGHGQAAVVGSALIDAIMHAAPGEMVKKARELVIELRGGAALSKEGTTR